MDACRAEVGNGDPNLQERRALCLRRRSGASMSACPRHRCGAMGPWDVHVPLAGGYSRCGGPHSRVRAAYVNVYLSNPTFRMDSDQMRVAVQRQLGVPLTCCAEAASANDQVDEFGDVFVNSGVDNDRPEHTSRHNAVLRQWIAGLKRGWPGKGKVRGDVGQRYRRASPNAKPDAWVWL